MNYIKKRLMEKSTYKGLIFVVGSALMHFTPDSIDKIIEAVMAAVGAFEIVNKDKND